MVIIDTNILVSEIMSKYEFDEETKQYRLLYEQIPLYRRVIPDFILNEFELFTAQVAPGRYKMNPEEKLILHEALGEYLHRIIHSFSLYSPSLSAIKQAYGIYFQYHKTHYISFTDSLILSASLNNSYAVLTKDKRLRDRAKELSISCLEPVRKEKN